MPVVDTLRLKTKLSDSGMPETQAQVLVEELDEALSTAIAAQVATKADVVELRAAISAIYERFEQVDKRFEQVDKRFEQVDKRFDDMNQRFNELNQSVIQMRSWLVGLYFFIAFGFLGMIMKDMIFR
jgi:peptidoglycan hydrolase CwlO-like protein